ncbi:MAG: PAS domain-containing protein, partial [Draconibacterium sp.]|nr:PAS domain-containing protein [Draconibacterium sp.]
MDFKISESLVNKLLNYSSDSICILDIKGIIIYTNQSWNSEFGFSSQELIGKKLSNHVPKEELKVFNNYFKSTINNQQSRVFQLSLLNKNKTKAEYNCTATYEPSENLTTLRA